MRFFIALLIATFIPVALMAQSDIPPGDEPPLTAIDLIHEAGTAADFDSAAYVIITDSSVVRIDGQGVAKTENYMLYKILTDDGCKEMSVLRWHYEPLSSYVEIRGINLIRNKEKMEIPLTGILDLPAPQSGIYWSDRIMILQLPRLRIGDGIEVISYRKGYSYALLDQNSSEPPDERYIPPMAGEYFDIVLFEATNPIVKKIYVLKMPSTKRIHSQIYNGPMYSSTSYNEDTTTYSWWISDVPAWEPQPRRPDDSDILTKVVIATVESWEAKSRWFFEVNEPQFSYTPAIKAKVDEIFRDAGVADGTEGQKAFELVHWVAQNIRYSGQTMGEGEGFTLHPGAMIFEQRSGVCKDIAGMLVTMMRAAGMDSYAAMTMAGSRIEEVPADQFNHCVVALRNDDGEFEMYDPTWVPFYKDIWSKYEAEQHYLIGSPRGEVLDRISYSPPEESPLRVRNKCDLLEDGTLEGTLSLEGEGTMDSRLRGFNYWFRLADVENYIARIIGEAGDRVEIIETKHGDILDFHANMWWRIKYRIPEYAMIIEDGYEFKSPMTQMNRGLYRYLSYTYDEKRRDDLFFYTSSHLDAEEEIKLPGGFKVDNLPGVDEADETYASFSGSGDMRGKKLIIKQDVKIKRRQIPQDGYDGFREVIKAANEFADSEFRAEKGGK